jgi:hypothetical protein
MRTLRIVEPDGDGDIPQLAMSVERADGLPLPHAMKMCRYSELESVEGPIPAHDWPTLLLPLEIYKYYPGRPSQLLMSFSLSEIVGVYPLGNTNPMVSTFVYPPPTDGKPFKLNMGLRSLELSAWLEGGEDLMKQIPERIDLAHKSKEVVYQELPGHTSAIDELITRALANLTDFHSHHYLIDSSSITYLPTQSRVELTDSPLLALASAIGEDLVVLHRDASEWSIVAGAVIFPSRWKLSEKIGKAMDAVHAPVPGYQSALAPYMTPTFDKVTADRPVWRKNWSLHSTEDLHQPTSIHAPATPENYWWRTERQTLTRSNDGNYLYFTIRNRVEPLHWIKKDPEAASAFAHTLETLLPETIEYKGLVKDHQAIIEYLRN